MSNFFQNIGLTPKPPKPMPAPVAPEPTPVAETPTGKQAREAIAGEEAKVKTALRTQLLETQGGILGEEIAEGGVKKRKTLLGN